MKETRISILCGQMLFTAMLMTSVALAIPRLAEDIELTMTMRGNLISVQYLGATVALIIGGILCDRYGKVFITRIFMLIASLVSIFYGVIWSFPSALIATFLMGAVNIILQNGIMSSGLDLGEKSRIGNSLLQTSYSIGAILIPLLYFICLQLWHWRMVYFIMAALFLIAFTISKGSPEKSSSESLFKMLKKYISFFKKPTFLFGPALVFLYIAAETGLWTFAPTFFEAEGYGLTSGIISSLLIWSMMLIGRIICIAFIKKTTIMRILIPFGLCGVCAYAAVMLLDGTAALICTAIAGFMCAPFYSLLTSFSTEISGDNSSTYVAFIMGMGTLGPTLLGNASGISGQILGSKYIILPALLAFIILVSVLIIYTIQKTKKSSNSAL